MGTSRSAACFRIPTLAGACLLYACIILGAVNATPTSQWLEKMDAVGKKLDRLHIPMDLRTCVTQVSPVGVLPQKAKLGVVIVACEEDLSVYNEIGCRDGRLHYHIYSKCGRSKAAVYDAAPHIKRCSSVTEVSSTIYTDLSWSKEHSEFLEHIIQRYYKLEDNLIFTSARMGRLDDVVSMRRAVDTALKGTWAYKSLWPTKLSVHFDQCPLSTCNVAQFGRELCALYKRYTCEADCFSCQHRNPWFDVPRLLQESRTEVSRCFFPNPLNTFIATSARIQRLPQSEYMWLRQWAQSWQEDAGGVLRRLIAERMWPVILGCPEDIHHNSTDGGCTNDMKFPSGERETPPEEMIDDGLVHSLPLHPTKHLSKPDLHTSKHPYPHLRSPKYGTYRLITFVATYATPVKVRTVLQLLKGAVGAALQFHPSARFFLLVRHDLMEELEQQLGKNVDWFAGRLEILPLPTRHPAQFGSQRSVEDLTGSFWTEAHQLELASGFLRQITPDTHDPSPNYGHIVFMPLNTVVLDHIWEAFRGRQDFTIALPAQPVPHQPLDTRIMFVHRRHIRAAEQLFSEAEEAIIAGGDGAQTFAEFIRTRHLSCLTGRQLAAAGSLPPKSKLAVQSCEPTTPTQHWQLGAEEDGEGEDETVVMETTPRASVRLLPCRLWAPLHARQERHDDAEPSTPRLMDACRMSFKNSFLTQLSPPNGFDALRVFHKMRELGDPSRGRAYMEQM